MNCMVPNRLNRCDVVGTGYSNSSSSLALPASVAALVVAVGEAADVTDVWAVGADGAGAAALEKLKENGVDVVDVVTGAVNVVGSGAAVVAATAGATLAGRLVSHDAHCVAVDSFTTMHVSHSHFVDCLAAAAREANVVGADGAAAAAAFGGGAGSCNRHTTKREGGGLVAERLSEVELGCRIIDWSRGYSSGCSSTAKRLSEIKCWLR